MKILPKVVEQDILVNYQVNLQNTDHIDSIEISSKDNFFYKEDVAFKKDINHIFFSYKMPHLGEFLVKIHYKYKDSQSLSLYCLNKDMMNRRPLKGDLHMHSTYSDGRTSPFAMVLGCLDAGMDFMSITDHDGYEGCLNALEKVEEHNINILLLKGEEVSTGGRKDMSIAQGNGHMLAINANKSIEQQRKDVDKYEKELEDIVEDLKTQDLEKDLNLTHYAKNIWVINKIKDAKGLAILSHPNWVYRTGKFHLDQAAYKEMLKSSRLDGVEIFGEEKVREYNNLVYITTYETQNKYKYLAPFGNSDAHDSDHEIGDRFTVIFAKEKTVVSIVEAIEEGLTCAVAKVDKKEHQFMGKDELARYVYFLLREYYPSHYSFKTRLAKLYIDQFINNKSFEKKINREIENLSTYDNKFFSE
ncbi:MAG: hypothetical protein COA66_02705 [Arcobacter sp.]|nr:MAG: hypothetical protein COA66_02705 [Arcobacter sp.]